MTILRHKLALLLLVLLSSSFARLHAQQPPPPAPPPASTTVRSILGAQLTGFATQCFGERIARRFGGKIVPKELTDDFGDALDHVAVVPINATALTRILRFAFQTEDLAEWQAHNLENPRFFSEAEVPAVPLPHRDVNNLLYTQSCASLLKLGASEELDISFSVASLRQAMAVEFDSSGRKDLAIVFGRFSSPLGAQLRSSDVSQSLAAHLSTWRLYRGRPALASGARYVDSLEAWLVTKQITAVRKGKLSVSAGGGAHWLVASAQGSTNAEVSASDSLEAGVYNVYVLRDPATLKPRVGFEPLPTPQAILALLKDSASQQQSPDLAPYYFLSDGAESRQRLVVVGMPEDFCAAGDSWTVATTSAAGTPELVASRFVPGTITPSAPSRCEFDIRLNSSWTTATSLAQNGALELSYELTKPSLGLQVAGQPLVPTINARVRIPLSEEPKVRPLADVPTSSSLKYQAAGVTLVLEVPFEVVDATIPVNRPLFGSSGRTQPVPASLACGSWKKESVLAWVEKRSASAYTLFAELPLVKGVEPPEGSCSLTAQLGIPRLTPAATIQRTVSAAVPITLPAKPPAPTPTPTPPPAPSAPAGGPTSAQPGGSAALPAFGIPDVSPGPKS